MSYFLSKYAILLQNSLRWSEDECIDGNLSKVCNCKAIFMYLFSPIVCKLILTRILSQIAYKGQRLHSHHHLLNHPHHLHHHQHHNIWDFLYNTKIEIGRHSQKIIQSRLSLPPCTINLYSIIYQISIVHQITYHHHHHCLDHNQNLVIETDWMRSTQTTQDYAKPANPSWPHKQTNKWWWWLWWKWYIRL